jgi:putative hemolysin
MLTEIAIVLVLALISGFFASSEMAVLTARKSRLKQLARESRRAQIVLSLTQTPERFLATVQLFITLITIVMGAYSGARVGQTIASWLAAMNIPLIEPYTLPIGMIVSVGLVLFLNMLFGELLPKRLALTNPEKIAMSVALPIRFMVALSRPFAFLLIASTRGLLRLLGQHRVSGSEVSEDEIRLLVSESAEQGVIDDDERNMVNRVLRLGDRSADSLMTPRNRIAWLDISAPLAENLAVMRDTPYSRYPVYRGGEQDVVGVLELKSLMETLGSSNIDLFRTLRKPLYVPATARAMDLLEEFRDVETPLALVVDEYGDIDGLVTINDLLAAVVGKSITPVIDTRAAPIVQRDDGSYLIDGSLGADDLRELLHLTQLPNQEDHDFHTAAGMMMAQFGRIPDVSEWFVWRSFRFEVVDLDGARIDKILISREGAASARTADDSMSRRH